MQISLAIVVRNLGRDCTVVMPVFSSVLQTASSVKTRCDRLWPVLGSSQHRRSGWLQAHWLHDICTVVLEVPCSRFHNMMRGHFCCRQWLLISREKRFSGTWLSVCGVVGVFPSWARGPLHVQPPRNLHRDRQLRRFPCIRLDARSSATWGWTVQMTARSSTPPWAEAAPTRASLRPLGRRIRERGRQREEHPFKKLGIIGPGGPSISQRDRRMGRDSRKGGARRPPVKKNRNP